MMSQPQVKRIKRAISGVLLLDKPLGFSSNQALQKAKWLLQAAKAGHTGTLDPLATGLLPLCFGEATKFAQIVTDADKTYIATLKLGLTTTTGDAEGEVISRREVKVTEAQFSAACQSFLGEISQVPPMYSALKVEGKPLYSYARAGVVLERAPRVVSIHNLRVLSFNGDIAQIEVTCSKGTYIRTLAEDIGEKLGCGAHLLGLRRIATAGFNLQNSVNLAQFEAAAIEARDQLLLPVDTLVAHLPALHFNADQAYYFRQGQPIWLPGNIAAGDLRLYDAQAHFMGLGFQQVDGKIAPKRLVNLI